MFVLGVSSSCKKSDVPAQPEPVLDPIEEVSLIAPENLNAPIVPQGDSTYNVIGYGYDLTGKHDDASSIRHKVVDIPAFVAAEKPDSFVPWRSTASWHDSYDAENAEVLANLLSNKSDLTKGQKLYGGTMSELFPKTAVFSEKYVYGYYSQYVQYKSFRFIVDNTLIGKFRKYLSPTFQSDVQNLNPEMMVKKYGTHVLAEIAIGAKLDVLYQAEVLADERSEIQENGYDAAIKTAFSFWTSRFNDIDSAMLRKVKSPALSFRVAGGDPSKIKFVKSTKGLHVDINGWLETIRTQNHVFIKADSTIPLSSLISDEKKRADVQAYITTYLENNQVKLSK